MAADAMLLEPIATFPVARSSAPAAVRPRGLPTPPSWRPAGRVKLTDEQLTRLVRRVGDQALAMLYARHHAGIERFCLGLLRHREDAAEAAQEAWARACCVLLGGRADVVRFRPWLYAIARNACVDRARERRRVEATEPAELDLPGAGAPGADEALAARDEVLGILADLALLSERQRSALLLRDVAGLSPVEAGEALGTTPDRVTWLAADARRSLEERRAGRDLGCEAVRDDLQDRRVGNRRLRAHLDQCAACRSFERGRRGRALSARCFGPVWLLRPAAERLLAMFGGGCDGPAALAKPLAAGTAALVLAAGGHAATQRDGHRPPPAPRVAIASAPAIVATAPEATAKPAARPRPARSVAAAPPRRRTAPRAAVVAAPARLAVRRPAAAPAVPPAAAPAPARASSPAVVATTTSTVSRAVAPATAVAGGVRQIATRAVATTTDLSIGAGSSLVRPAGP